MIDFRNSVNRWCSIFVLSSWLSNIGHGLMITVMGPMQPYLARNVNVDIDQVNFVWTFGFIGYIFGSIGCGLVFKRYLKSARLKLSFLWASMSLTGIGMIAMPFVDSFPLLVAIRCIQNVCLGAYITADASMLVFTMGPVKSRPFTNALHACVGVGFVAATFLVRPFLPDESKAVKDREVVCGIETEEKNQTFLTAETQTENSYEIAYMGGIDSIAWPFIISGAWCLFAALGYFLLGWCSNLEMPRFYEMTSSSNLEETAERKAERGDVVKQDKKIKLWVPVLIVTFVYYCTSCGIERIFQSMAYTYGLCGPLQLKPSAAVLIDSCYNGGFVFGRIVSVGVVKILKPRTMIFISTITCIASALVLIFLGSTDMYWLYAGSSMIGMAVSWQFGCCYSWIAQKGNVTGKLSPLFFIGAGLGSAVTPPLSGFIFTSDLGPNGILYLTFVACVLQFCNFSAMWLMSRIKG